MIDNLKILANRTKTYRITPKNQVGTDDDYKALWGSTAMPLRTVTTHTDLNSIYVAPNGNDSTGDGTQSNPYLTLQKGVDEALINSFGIVTVIRNSYVGDIIFEENLIIQNNLILQVESDETATINPASRYDIVDIISINKVDNYIGKIIELPNNDLISIFGYDGAGYLYKSIDDGENWVLLNNDRYFKEIILLSTNRLVGTSPSDGIYYSDDYGVTWSQSNITSNTYIKLYELSTTRLLASSSANVGIYYSDNYGATWSQTAQTTLIFTDILESSTNRIIAKADGNGVGSDGVYYSDDTGINWTRRTYMNLSGAFNSTLLQINTNRFLCFYASGVYYSDDDGITWALFGSSPLLACGLQLSTNRIIAGGTNGIFYSDNSGANWTQSDLDILIFQNIIKTNTGRLLIGSENYNVGFYYNDDNLGVSWNKFNLINGDNRSLIQTSTGRVITAYATFVDTSNVWYSDNINSVWYPSDLNVGNKQNFKLLELQSGRILVLYDNGSATYIYYSDDDGETWTDTGFSSFLMINGSIIQLESGILLSTRTSGTSGIYYSSDEGATWTVSDLTSVIFGSFYQFENGRVIGVYNNKLYFSDNDGKNWLSYNTNITYCISLISCLNDRLVCSYNGIIYYSDNEGLTWTQSTIGGSLSYVYKILLLSDNKLYAVANSGILSSIDNGATWEILFDDGNTFYDVIELSSYQILFTDTYYSSTSIGVSGFVDKTVLLNGFNIEFGLQQGYSLSLSNVKNCNITNCNLGISFEGNLTIQNSIFSNCVDGVDADSVNIQESLFYNIENYAVTQNSTGDFVFEHNTVYLSKIGLLIDNSVTGYTLKNNIFYKNSTYDVSSTVTDLIQYNTVATGSQYGNSLDSSTTKTYNPLFYAADENDFRVKVEEQQIEGIYPNFNSPAKNLADDTATNGDYYDAGCYLIQRDLLTDTYQDEVEIIYPPNSSTLDIIYKNKTEFTDYLGSYYSFNRGKKKRWTFVWDQSSQTDMTDIYEQTTKLQRIINVNDVIKMEFDSQGFSGSGNLLASGDYYVLTDTTKDNVEHLLEGYGLTLTHSVSGDFLFKCYDNTTNTFILENDENYTNIVNNDTYTYQVNFIKVRVIKQDQQYQQNPFVSILPSPENLIYLGGSLIVEEE